MTTSTTFDETLPRRPGINDLGDEVENDPVFAPKPGMPSAEMFNMLRGLAVALGGLIPVAGLSVRFSGGAPLVDLYFDVRTSHVTPTLVDNGNGDTSITWPANTFPAPALRHGGMLNDDAARSITVAPITNGVRVKTRTAADSGADCAFTVLIW